MLRLGQDTLAEWLRRRPAKPMGSPRVGSNPTGVAVGRGCSSWCVLTCVRTAGDDERRKSVSKSASAGNRTRVTSMATMYSTTRPLMRYHYTLELRLW